jgi:hypothetical protein
MDEEQKLHAHVKVMAEEKFVPHFNEAIKRGIEQFPDRPYFYVANTHKAEIDMPVIKEDKWYPLLHCPTPVSNQMVFKYTVEGSQFELIWTIPPEDHFEHYIEHSSEVVPEEQELLGYIVGFLDGSLQKKSDLLNGDSQC